MHVIVPTMPRNDNSSSERRIASHTLTLSDLGLPDDYVDDAERHRADLGQTEVEFLAEAIERGRDREADTEDGPAPLRVRFKDDRERATFGVTLVVEQLRDVEAQAEC